MKPRSALHKTLKSACLVAGLSFLASEQSLHGAEVFIGAGGGYDQLQLTNSTGTGDAYYTGIGYSIIAKLRLRGSLIKNSSIDFWGGYQNFQTANTADLSEKNVISPLLLGVQTRFYFFLLGVDYQISSSQITTASGTFTKSSRAIGVSAGIEIPFSQNLNLQIVGAQHFGIAPGEAGNSGSRAISELTGAAYLQFRVFQFRNSDS